MELNTETLLDELQELLGELDQQIEVITKQAKRMDCSPYAMKNPDGSWALANLLSAKAQLLSTYVLLRAKQERKQSWIQPHHEH